MKRFVVELEVLAPRFGDPALFPSGYSTVARFIGEPADANAWSIVIDQSEVLGAGPRSISQAHFLFDEAAPTRLTTPGVRFEMFEGATVVARGVMRGEHTASREHVSHSSITTGPDSLIPLAEGWMSDGQSTDLAPEVWVSLVGNYQLAIAYSLLFWPRFKLLRGSIVRSEVDEAQYLSWMTELGGDRSAVERMVNHLHISDIHHIECSDQSPDRFHYLGSILRETTAAKLCREYPGRTFRVVYQEGSAAYLSQYAITFWEENDGASCDESVRGSEVAGCNEPPSASSQPCVP